MPPKSGKDAKQGNPGRGHPATDSDRAEQIVKGLTSGDSGARQAALEALKDLRNEGRINEEVARENVGVVLTGVLENVCGTEKSSVLHVLSKLQMWKGPIGKQLASPYTAKVLWNQLQFHHREIEIHKSKPVCIEPEPVKSTKQKKGKEPQVVEETLVGLGDEDLYCVLRILTSGSSTNETFVKEIYEKDFAPLGSILANKNPSIKVQILRLMRVLGRNTLLLRCFCQYGFVRNLVDLLEPPEDSEEADKEKEIILYALKLLNLLTPVGGAIYMELSIDDILKRLMKIVLQESSESETKISGIESELQATALELVISLIKDNICASQKAISLGIIDAIASLTPTPGPEIVSVYRGTPKKAEGTPAAEGFKGTSDTIFAGLAASNNKEEQTKPENEVESTRECCFGTATCKTTSPRICVLCLQLLTILCNRDSTLQNSIHSGSTVPWHYWMMYFLESKGTNDKEVPKEIQSQPPPKSKDNSKAKKLASEEESQPVADMGPPFPPPVQAAACYCLNELAKSPLIADELLETPKTLQFLLNSAVTDTNTPYPFNVVHPIAKLITTLTAFAIKRHSGLDKNSKIEDAKLVDALKGLSKQLLEGSFTNELSVTKRQLACAALGIDSLLFQPPVRPPLPSPPPTPPPPLLPTSQFAWDALGRPVVNDGLTLRSM